MTTRMPQRKGNGRENRTPKNEGARWRAPSKPRTGPCSEFRVSLLQVDQRVLARHLEFDQQLARDHVAVLLVVGQLDRGRHHDPAVDVAVEYRRLALLVAHM